MQYNNGLFVSLETNIVEVIVFNVDAILVCVELSWYSLTSPLMVRR